MSKRSEKEARNNNELISQLFPVLAVTALLSYFQYRKLKKQYLANPQAKRIDDLMAHTPILVAATLGNRNVYTRMPSDFLSDKWAAHTGCSGFATD